MPTKARIRLWSTNIDNLNFVVNQIKTLAQKTGVEINGPIPLPTTRMEVPVMRLPHGEGRKKWEHWEMKVHKRIIDIATDERVMRQLMRVRVPDDVYIEIELV